MCFHIGLFITNSMHYPKAKILFIVSFSFLILFYSCENSGNQKSGNKQELIIFHAGSLSVPMHQMADSFMKNNPDIKVLFESAGSRECARKITELKKPCDIMASSDYYVIRDMLIPEFAGWYINFAGNEMCIAYNHQSRLHEKLTTTNWFSIVMDKTVSFGRSNPDNDPCGYRTLQVFKLSSIYYKNPALAEKLAGKDGRFIRPKEVDLLALLESRSLDYIFIYRSVAIQHKLDYLTLPDEINLKNPSFAKQYAVVQVEIKGKEAGKKTIMKAEPMVYAFTILKNAPNKDAALKFADFILSDKGKSIMEQNGQPSIIFTDSSLYNKIPSSLIKYLRK